MTLNYYGDEMEMKEIIHDNRPFLGYISPSGDLLDFSYLIGEPGHGNWRNPVTPLFTRYISYVNLGDNIVKYKDSEFSWDRDIYEKNKYEGFSDSVLRGSVDCFGPITINKSSYEDFLKMLEQEIQEMKEAGYRCMDEWTSLKLDLMLFFEKCYSKRDFFYSFGNVIKVPCYDSFLEMKGKDLKWLGFTENSGEIKKYREYVIATLMHSVFKEILVQYLGYDSIERAIPNDSPYYLSKNLYHPSYGFDYSKYPLILTSCSNPNERFYNWISNGWEIKQLDRMLWSEEEQRFVISPTRIFHQSDKEIALGNELETLKRENQFQKRR